MSQAPPPVPGHQNPFVQPPAPPAPRSSSGCGCFLLGCLVMGVAGLLICGGLGLYVRNNWRGMVAGPARQVAQQLVDDSQLPADQKQEVMQQVDRVIVEFKEGRLTTDQAEKLMTSFSEGPLFVLMMAYTVEEKYVKPSGLSDDEKKEAHLTLQRVARGVYEKRIDSKKVEAIFDPVMEKGPGDEKKLPERISDEQLRTLLRNAKQLADDTNIPEEEFEVNVGQAVKEAVDKALAEPQAQQ